MARKTRWNELTGGVIAGAAVIVLGAVILIFGRVGSLHGDTFQLYVATNDRPKLANLRDMFPELWRDDPVLVLAAFGT